MENKQKQERVCHNNLGASWDVPCREIFIHVEIIVTLCAM